MAVAGPEIRLRAAPVRVVPALSEQADHCREAGIPGPSAEVIPAAWPGPGRHRPAGPVPARPQRERHRSDVGGPDAVAAADRAGLAVLLLHHPPEIWEQWLADLPPPSLPTLYRWLQRTVEQGLVLRDRTGRRNAPYRHWVKGQEVQGLSTRWGPGSGRRIWISFARRGESCPAWSERKFPDGSLVRSAAGPVAAEFSFHLPGLGPKIGGSKRWAQRSVAPANPAGPRRGPAVRSNP